ncbi:MAG: hypothetical protein M3Y58_13445 [Chloroflexota bacterium]|nr:hypothetical protein [Chloroflexota bacterium]
MDDTCVHSHHPLRTLSRPEPPPELHARIAAAVRVEAARQQQYRRLRRGVFAGVTALLSLVVVVHGFLH